MTTPDEEFLIEDLEGFRVIDNPLRQRLLHLARHPKSVRELADALEVPVTRLYYHVNMLEKAGFIEAVDVRKSGAQLERVYQRLAPYLTAKTHRGGRVSSCPECSSQNTEINRHRISAAGHKKVQFRCLDCGKYHTVPESKWIKEKE